MGTTPHVNLYKGNYSLSQILEYVGTPGNVVFDNTTNRIYAGTEGSSANVKPKMFGSNIQDATFANSILDIYKVGYTNDTNTPELHIKLDFHDIASASAMMAVFQSLYQKMGLSGDNHDTVDYTGTNYLTSKTNLIDADKELDTQIKSKAVVDTTVSTGNYTVPTYDTTNRSQALQTAVTSGTVATGDTAIEAINKLDNKLKAVVDEVDLVDNVHDVKINGTSVVSTKEANIAVDGTYVASGDNANKIATQSTVTNAIEELDVTEYAQASVDVDTTNHTSALKIKGIKETDGKIAAATTTPTFDVAIKGEYDASSNKLITEDAIKDLDVSGYAQMSQAANATTSTDSDITIKGIKETDGKIEHDSTNDQTIYVEGTHSSSNKIITKSVLTSAIEDLDVNEYAQAEITTTSGSGASTLKIKGIKETDGKIAAATTTPTFDVAIDGEYDSSTNKIATKSTVTNTINDLDVTTDKGAASISGSTITINAVQQEDGLVKDGGSTTIELDGTYDSTTNKIATKSTVTTAINALDTQSDVQAVDYTAADSTNGAKLTFKGVAEVDGVIQQGTGSTELQFAKVATTGAAADISITDSGNKTDQTTVEGALQEIYTEIGNLKGSYDAIISTSAATTPKDIVWDNSGTNVTGTLTASEDTWHKIYFVPTGTPNDGYAEYVTIRTGTVGNYTYSWEKLGNASVDLKGYVKSVTINGKVINVDTNSTNVSLGDIVTSVVAETAISGGVSDYVSVSQTTVKNTTNGTDVVTLASAVKIEEVADGITKDSTASYTSGHWVIENGKLVSADGKSSGDTYTKSANDGLVLASDVMAYVQNAIQDAKMRWSNWE